MRVKMLTLSAGPDGVHTPGEIREVSPEQARELIAGGFAVPVERIKAVVTIEEAPEVETTEAVPAQERAVTRKSKRG